MKLINSEKYYYIFKECLGTGATADMITAYFSCYMFELFKDEFETYFTTNNKIRIVIGSDTSIEELQFIQNIEKLKDEEITDFVIETYFDDIKLVGDDTLRVIHRLFSERLIDVRIGFSSKSGIFHGKFYTFKDESNYKVLNGSLNFTRNAIFNNFEVGQLMEDEETYEVFTSSFNNLWNDIQIGARCKKLNEVILSKINQEAEKRNISLVEIESNVQLRSYQEEAINSLLRNDMNGFLKMATGTGKTFTSIYALKKYKEYKNQNLITHIVVPYKHLADQWSKSIKEVFPNAYIIECHSENVWREKFNNIRYEGTSKDCFAVFVSGSFKNNTRVIERGISEATILIVDEAHNLTVSDLEALSEMEYQHKVGLSATPEHYVEIERTKKLFEYFKGEIFEYGLENAIRNGYLTNYNYYPILVNLDEEEIDKYKKLDIKIKDSQNKNDILNLLEERNLLLSLATGKIVELKKLLEERVLDKSLVYCNPGKVKGTDLTYIEYVADAIRDVRPNAFLEKITASESKDERSKIVRRLETGSIAGILAIKCLDEGFDIPCVKDAYILSSTRNPKEFVQRRGRVLRCYPGKEITNIFDFIVAIDSEVLVAEQARFNEYSSLASNQIDIKNFRENNKWEKINE